MLLLLSDGSVMAQQAPSGTTFSNAWYRLTPVNGSYVAGQWTAMASMNQQRLFYSSVVLQDGRVFVAGGEYGSNGTRTPPGGTPNSIYLASAEIYDPKTNVWTALPAVPSSWSSPGNPFAFGDSIATLLPNGNVLIGPVYPNGGNRCAIYDVANNAWIDGALYLNGVSQNESSWLKLPDGSVLTVPQNSTAAQRFLPATNQWVNDGSLPSTIYSSLGSEVGSAHFLSNGKGFFIGANGNTALYTPSGGVLPWTAGPGLPTVPQNTLDNNGVPNGSFNTTGAAPDASAATLPNGRLLLALSGPLYNDMRAGTTPPGATNNFWLNAKNPLFATPTSFFEYDPVSTAFTPVSGPTGPTDNIPAYQGIMLALPDGSILYSDYGSQLYVYRSSGTPLPAGKPAVNSIAANGDGSFHLTGTGLNGISFGASFGDDAQMDTNYPIVRLNDSSNNAFYARTFNWSSNSIATGSLPVTTEFTLPNSIFFGGPSTYSLVAVANGNPSNPVTFFGPLWVDFTFTGTSTGTFAQPYKTFASGTAAVPVGGTVIFKGPRSSAETVTSFNKPVTLISYGGAVTIGQ
ncbi:MAG: kelch repeat-containing protein [Chthoniobacterales bacterium]